MKPTFLFINITAPLTTRKSHNFHNTTINLLNQNHFSNTKKMKWGGRRKPSSSSSLGSSSSKPSFISPFSWLSKLKQMRINNSSEPKQEKQMKQNNNTKQNDFPSDNSPCETRERFYREDGDEFWRLSFCVEGNNEHKESEDVINPEEEKYNLDGAERHGRRESMRLRQKEIGEKEERELLNEAKCEKELEFLRRRYERKAHRVLQEHLLKSERAELQEVEFAPRSKYLEKDDEIQFESPRTIRTPRMHLFSSPSASSTQNSEKKWRQDLKQAGEEELKAKISKPRKSVHVSREMQGRKPKNTSSKVRVYSPKIGSKVEICKIKALEEKKAKLKMKREEETVEENLSLDSFAVVKTSLDPQQDFMDSMIEMITEKQISKPEEMEELLACYLTLNSNEYHDLIIEVFKQVWLYLSQASLGVKSDKLCCCHD